MLEAFTILPDCRFHILIIRSENSARASTLEIGTISLNELGLPRVTLTESNWAMSLRVLLVVKVPLSYNARGKKGVNHAHIDIGRH